MASISGTVYNTDEPPVGVPSMIVFAYDLDEPNMMWGIRGENASVVTRGDEGHEGEYILESLVEGHTYILLVRHGTGGSYKPVFYDGVREGLDATGILLIEDLTGIDFSIESEEPIQGITGTIYNSPEGTGFVTAGYMDRTLKCLTGLGFSFGDGPYSPLIWCYPDIDYGVVFVVVAEEPLDVGYYDNKNWATEGACMTLVPGNSTGIDHDFATAGSCEGCGIYGVITRDGTPLMARVLLYDIDDLRYDPYLGGGEPILDPNAGGDSDPETGEYEISLIEGHRYRISSIDNRGMTQSFPWWYLDKDSAADSDIFVASGLVEVNIDLIPGSDRISGEVHNCPEGTVYTFVKALEELPEGYQYKAFASFSFLPPELSSYAMSYPTRPSVDYFVWFMASDENNELLAKGFWENKNQDAGYACARAVTGNAEDIDHDFATAGPCGGLEITSVDPESGIAYQGVAIHGSGFGAEQGEGFALVGAENARILYWSDIYVDIEVPRNAPGPTMITVRNNEGESDSIAFTVLESCGIYGVLTGPEISSEIAAFDLDNLTYAIEPLLTANKQILAEKPGEYYMYLECGHRYRITASNFNLGGDFGPWWYDNVDNAGDSSILVAEGWTEINIDRQPETNRVSGEISGMAGERVIILATEALPEGLQYQAPFAVAMLEADGAWSCRSALWPTVEYYVWFDDVEGEEHVQRGFWEGRNFDNGYACARAVPGDSTDINHDFTTAIPCGEEPPSGLRITSLRSIFLKLGDNAGAEKIIVQDSEDTDVLSIDSGGRICATVQTIPTSAPADPQVGDIWYDVPNAMILIFDGEGWLHMHLEGS